MEPLAEERKAEEEVSSPHPSRWERTGDSYLPVISGVLGKDTLHSQEQCVPVPLALPPGTLASDSTRALRSVGFSSLAAIIKFFLLPLFALVVSFGSTPLRGEPSCSGSTVL